ncbi:hypothetical protein OAX11_02210 [Flavobacteriaceae bacterium]|nr:hypothetical protein [Flavobacteriaceae bacterium]
MLHNSNNVPGLQSKCVTIDLANTIGTAEYIFTNQKYLDDYLKSELLPNFNSFLYI